jgi:hypothetical protein
LEKAAAMIDKSNYDWILFYWMPYDNDLWRFGSQIVQMLTIGAQGENTLVVIVSDLSGEESLTRRIITNGEEIETHQLQTANSSSVEVYADQLDWIRSRFTADRWATIFLGHGGRLDEVSPDEYPFADGGSQIQWMNIVQLAEVLSDFNRNVHDRLELLFLQNCCKGTLEAHYTFQNSAKFTISSQTELGAPNYYYEGLLQSLDHAPAISGLELAERIMEFERHNMYNSYTVTSNAAFLDLPSKIKPFIMSILQSNYDEIQMSHLFSYPYSEDQFVDAISFFHSIGEQVEVDQKIIDGLVNHIKNSVIQGFRESPKNKYPGLSGLSLLLPRSKDDLNVYRYMQVFSDLMLVDLFDVVLK